MFQGKTLRIAKGLEMPTTIRTIDDVYSILFKENIDNKVANLVAYGSSEETYSFIPVKVRDRGDGTTLYRELIGINLDNEKVYRGPNVLALISEAVSKSLGKVEKDEASNDIPFMVQVSLVETVKKRAVELLNPLAHYTSRLERINLRDSEKTWIKSQDLEVTFQNPVCKIQFVKLPKSPPEKVPEEVKREIEEKAVDFVIGIEKEEGRLPERVPDKEHYDIRSVDPSFGEVRVIEVKGHKNPEIYGELTHDEAKLAEKEQNRYWLYVVYDIQSGKPKHLRF
jgi:hypothetical protein